MKRLAPHLDEIREQIIEGSFSEMVQEMMKNNDFDGDNRISEDEFYVRKSSSRANDEL